MKKIVFLTLVFTAPLMAWNFTDLWHNITNYFSFTKPEPSAFTQKSSDVIQRTWNNLTPEQQKIAMMAALLISSGAAYLAWPDQKQVAYEKAERYAEELRKKIDDSAKITADKLKAFTINFKYGLPRSSNKFVVIAEQVFNKNNRVLNSQVKIIDWYGGILYYTKNNNEWIRSATENFFKDIVDVIPPMPTTPTSVEK